MEISIGKTIKKLRAEKGITQEDLAKYLNITLSYTKSASTATQKSPQSMRNRPLTPQLITTNYTSLTQG